MSANETCASQPTADAINCALTDLEAPPISRSAFVQFLTAVISFLVVGIPTAIGGLFFLDPLLRKRSHTAGNSDSAGVFRKDEAGFIRLDVTTDVIPIDGTPVAVTVFDDIEDAWNLFRDVPVGSIWLRKNPDTTIMAFNSVCPHLGCSINYRRSTHDFHCPCHMSAFALDGRKTNQVPPRDMDSLQVAIRSGGKDDPAGTEIWVKFQNFRKAAADKTPQ